MSKVRRQPARFLGKGPNGRNLCFCGCGREVERPRLNWYSDECVQKWQAINDPATVRRLVFERDHGICALCGVDTEARRREVAEWKQVFEWLARRHFKDHPEDVPKQWWMAAETAAQEEIERRFGKGLVAHDGHTWENDHVVPVIEGGGQCGLDNYRTLCLPCHKQVTRELAARRAVARREAKKQSGVFPSRNSRSPSDKCA